jgi:DivIVA domain-containing protein
MRCLGCGEEGAGTAEVCGRCGAPIAQQASAAVGRAAGAASDAAGAAARAAVHASAGRRRPASASRSKVDGAILAGWAGATMFSATRLRPGYDRAEVDAFLGAIRDTFLGEREPSLTPDEIRDKRFSATRLRRGYDEEEVDAFLDEAELRLAAQADARGGAQQRSLAAAPAGPRCLECGAESARATEVCARCGAPVAGRESAADPAAGAVSNGVGQAGSAATAWATGPTRQQPYVPGRGGKVPPGLRRVLHGYSWMAWGAVSAGWALFMTGGYFYNLDNTSDLRYVYASIASVLLAAILFGRHIRWSLFLKRPRDACSATVAASRRAGHVLVLDAPEDGYPSGLEVRLAWWAEPEMLLPGESVRFYGRPGGVGRLLVSSSAPDRAFAGTGRRRPVSRAGQDAAQTVPHQPGGQWARRRYLRWGPPAIFGVGLAAAVMTTLVVWVPSLTGHLGTAQFRPGDCLTGAALGLGSGRTWPYMVAPVPCTDPHLAEVFFAGNAWPRSPTAYPGDNTISGQGYARCLTAFSAYDGTGPSASAFSIDYVIPYSDNWSSGNRWLVCMAYDPSRQNPRGSLVDYSIKGTGQ